MLFSLLFSFFKHFIPLSKRMLSLLFRKKSYPVLTIIKSEYDLKNIEYFLIVDLKLINTLFLIVDKNIYPIFHDNVQLQISIPAKKDVEEIEIKAIGLFKSKSKKLSSSFSSKLYVESILFDRIGNIADKKLNNNLLDLNSHLEPIGLNLNEAPNLITAAAIKEKIKMINPILNMNVNLDLIELELELKKQKIYE